MLLDISPSGRRPIMFVRACGELACVSWENCDVRLTKIDRMSFKTIKSPNLSLYGNIGYVMESQIVFILLLRLLGCRSFPLRISLRFLPLLHAVAEREICIKNVHAPVIVSF